MLLGCVVGPGPLLPEEPEASRAFVLARLTLALLAGHAAEYIRFTFASTGPTVNGVEEGGAPGKQTPFFFAFLSSSPI